MPRQNATNKSAYKKHAYSGPRKNRKRVLAGLRSRATYSDDDDRSTSIPSRDVWRKQEEKKRPQRHDIQTSDQDVAGPSNIKTYLRPKPLVQLEATFPSNVTNTELPAQKSPLNINWPEPDPAVEAHNLQVETTTDDNFNGLSGYRIVDVKHVLNWAFTLEQHTRHCENSQIEFMKELRTGLHSEFILRCSMCNKTWKETSEKDEKVNKSFVWATVTAGSYYAQAAHITSVMDIPSMTAKKFRAIETELGQIWQDHLTEEIVKAGQDERAIAIEKGHVDSDNVPYITVYVDGGWLKRSYGHNFNSPSGMACIIGKETKKCLFLGVRNKYCYMCQYNERKGIDDPKEHMCWKNYTGASTAMEANILVEGFQKSMEMHGLQYLAFIGDGDSSVYTNLREKVSYGQKIKKIECKNHVVKNYTSALYKILGNKKLPLHGRNILKPKLAKLTIVTRKMIMHQSNNPNAMRNDLRNGPLHVFGRHDNCQEYYCKLKNSSEVEKEKVEDLVEKLQKDAATVWALIIAANEAVISKAGRLSNETTNIAENFMSVINKFNCGKRISFGKAGSYQRRVHIAGLSQTTGYKWHLDAWKKTASESPGQHFKKYIRQKEKSQMRQKLCSRKRLFVPGVKRQKQDKDYGPEAQDPVDIDAAELLRQCDEKLADLQKTAAEISTIETETIGQHDNELYNLHRNDRLTASQFGMICKRRTTTPCHNHVKLVLYKKNFTTTDTAYGEQNEHVARNLFITSYNKTVRQTGLFIDDEYGFLGASPDGVIDSEQAIIEIKCFPSLARTSQDIETAAKEKNNFPLQFKDGVLVMNKKHNYYYQIQGQLRVTKMNKCFFIGFVSVTQPITVVEVDRDEEFINTMVPKLIAFYKNCIVPEIILRRVQKNSKCKELKEYIDELRGLSST